MSSSLHLDLSACDAKIARARVHLESLKREVARVLNERHPYTLRVGEIDVNSGWCSVFLLSNDIQEYGLGVIFGDLIHNLRCVLDYIVTALVEASGATVSSRHQFPIFTDQAEYVKRVGSASAAVSSGPLGGVTHGLREIWELQPFHRKPKPGFPSFLPGVDPAWGDPLFHIYVFSNADKHRIISSVIPNRIDVKPTIIEDNAIAKERWRRARWPEWEPNVEYEVMRVRFAPPYPSEVRAKADITMSVLFSTPGFGKLTEEQAIDIGIVEGLCDYVSEIAEMFKTL